MRILLLKVNNVHSPADGSPSKKATTLRINKNLLDEARSLNIDLSATLERALAERIREEKRKQWIAANREAIQACNELADKNGLFSDKWRVI